MVHAVLSLRVEADLIEFLERLSKGIRLTQLPLKQQCF